jgi:hypothetical protein
MKFEEISDDAMVEAGCEQLAELIKKLKELDPDAYGEKIAILHEIKDGKEVVTFDNALMQLDEGQAMTILFKLGNPISLPSPSQAAAEMVAGNRTKLDSLGEGGADDEEYLDAFMEGGRRCISLDDLTYEEIERGMRAPGVPSLESFEEE